MYSTFILYMNLLFLYIFKFLANIFSHFFILRYLYFFLLMDQYFLLLKIAVPLTVLKHKLLYKYPNSLYVNLGLTLFSLINFVFIFNTFLIYMFVLFYLFELYFFRFLANIYSNFF